MPEPVKDRILVVENDPLVADLVSRQSLQAAGYQVFHVEDASLAINRAIQLNPDAIIANINLPGLSGKDLMVALSSQGLDIPVIMMIRKGQEADLIQAFRLGAVDTLCWPVKEPEVINAVERVLRSVRERKERERLARQLQQTNQELQQRVRELTTIFAIGKAVTSITDQTLLFERILEGSTRVTQADLAWFLLRPAESQPFHLVAQRGLPASVAEFIQRPWEDGVSSLVALSGEALSIHGEPVKRFKIASFGQSALIVPIKVQRPVIGLLVVMRKQPLPFTISEQRLLEAVADYASISISNARLFRVVEERARGLEGMAGAAHLGEKINQEMLVKVQSGLRAQSDQALAAIEKLTKDPLARWTPDQRQVMSALLGQVQAISRITEGIQFSEEKASRPDAMLNLVGIVQQVARQAQPAARYQDITLTIDLPSEPLAIQASGGHISQALSGLLRYAIQNSRTNSQVTVKLEKTADRQAHGIIWSTGLTLEPRQAAALFEVGEGSQSPLTTGLGLSLPLVKEIISFYKGKVWVENRPGQGFLIHYLLPSVS